MVVQPTLIAQVSHLLHLLTSDIIGNFRFKTRIRGGGDMHFECQFSLKSLPHQTSLGLDSVLEPLGCCKSYRFQNLAPTDQSLLIGNLNGPFTAPQFNSDLCAQKRNVDPQIQGRQSDETQENKENSLRSSSPSSDLSIDISSQDSRVRREASRRWMQFELARDLVRRQGYRLRSEFWMWKERPRDIPYNPDKAYKHEGWTGAPDESVSPPQVLN